MHIPPDWTADSQRAVFRFAKRGYTVRPEYVRRLLVDFAPIRQDCLSSCSAGEHPFRLITVIMSANTCLVGVVR